MERAAQEVARPAGARRLDAVAVPARGPRPLGRQVGDWALAARMAQMMLEHDPNYAGTHYALAPSSLSNDGNAATSPRVRFGRESVGKRGQGPARAGRRPQEG